MNLEFFAFTTVKVTFDLDIKYFLFVGNIEPNVINLTLPLSLRGWHAKFKSHNNNMPPAFLPF